MIHQKEKGKRNFKLSTSTKKNNKQQNNTQASGALHRKEKDDQGMLIKETPRPSRYIRLT